MKTCVLFLMLVASISTAASKDIVVGEAELVAFMKTAVLGQQRAITSPQEAILQEQVHRQQQQIAELKKQLQACTLQEQPEVPPSPSTVAGTLSDASSTTAHLTAPRRRAGEAQELAEAVSSASLWLQKDSAKVIMGSAADVSLFRSGAGEMCAAADVRVEGKLGVGATTSPTAKLEIVDGEAFVTKLKIDDTNNNSNDYHILCESNTGGADTPQFWTKSNGDAFVAGKLGVGAPAVSASKVEIRAAPRATAFSAANGATWHDVVIANPSGAAGSAAGLFFQTHGTYHTNSGTGIAAVLRGSGDFEADLVFVTRPYAAVAKERVRIEGASGNVGVGTDAPAERLHVAGKVRAADGFCIATDCISGWSTVSQHTTLGALKANPAPSC